MKRRPAASGSASSIVLDDPALRFLQGIWRLENALERVSKRMEATLGISGPQRFALRLISDLPGVGARELASVLHLHPSTVTGVVQRLEARGLITRVSHATDGRRLHLHLTPAGKRILRPTIHGTVEHAARATIRSSSTAKMRAAVDVLDRFSNELLNE
jgi:MarR family transcriptional regulator, organic hydroperoxide resistance regulator